MSKICETVSLNNNSENKGKKIFIHTLEKGHYGRLKFRYITFILSNVALSVINRK